MTTHTLTTTPHRDATVRTPATLDVLIRAKRARIAALRANGWTAAAKRAEAELKELEGRQG